MIDVRRFWCHQSIFSERLTPEVARPWASRTLRMQKLVRHLAVALGGRPAQFLASRVLLPVNKDAFLRSLRAGDDHAKAAPRIFGIDEWAWLRDHPGVACVARDRNGGYGSAVARAFPEAVQVADRWHFLETADEEMDVQQRV
ncbi:transposase [Alloyangia pacifica]|uniref:transposase n=1 Tax=Alloyangia pacifica TaxID=311180 RepID=UPI00131F3B37|nr:transposase [Alloyangia pacifica]